MITGKILRCLECGEPYEFMSHMVGDQSMCPSCHGALVRRIEDNKKKWIKRETYKPRRSL